MRSRGFTLIEWLIAMLIGVFLVGGGLSIFVASRATTEDAFDQSELQENGRIAMRMLTQDLKWAGFWGDYTGSPMAVGPGVAVLGSATSGCGSLPTSAGTRSLLVMKVGNTGNLVGEDSSCIPTNSNWSFNSDTDVISLKRLIGHGFSVSSKLNANRFYMATTTESAKLFAIENESDAIPSEVINMSNPQVWEYQHVIYYSVTNKDDNVPELRKRILTVNSGSWQISGPMAEGVEKISLMLGVDDTADGIVDRYIPSGSVSLQEWNSEMVISVRIFILIRSKNASNRYVDKKTYIVGSIPPYTPNDNYRRLLLESSVSLRNPAVITGGGL
ncbi:PilW family protein [Aeromonas caviae]|uniref:PilW family protein n=2 Tax=Aeromonas caviae TaxID=648 RepID=UPI000F5EB26E|nr:PilW family protein [Aeromonas caviae]RQX21790.1 prepilin-type N-terminal cleavage/methylation domain-containing protein [Aeromonas caviae]